ncbi:MAG TPA: hypothetical protein PLP42_00285 [Acidobacteriota bacterium]|nr:hypothetical protein [Acidobacteriota bacterium]
MTAFYVWLKTQLTQLRNDQKGVTIVEYVIMIALVALAVALASPNVRDAVVSIFEAVESALTDLEGSAGT